MIADGLFLYLIPVSGIYSDTFFQHPQSQLEDHNVMSGVEEGQYLDTLSHDALAPA